MSDQSQTERLTRRDLVEGNVDKVMDLAGKHGQALISKEQGGLIFRSPMEIMDSAKMMATAGPLLPEWLQGNPGGCWGIIIQAIEWDLSPIAVAQKSYIVNKRVGYESQLVHAVIERRAPLLERLKSRFEGEGNERKCTVYAKVKGEDGPLEWSSPTVGTITTKNSPLWKSDPDQQLFYYTSRTWARRWFPDVLLGIYTADELRDPAFAAITEAGDQARDITPRLPGHNGGEGFNADRIKTTLAGTPVGSRDELANIVPDAEVIPAGEAVAGDRATEKPAGASEAAGGTKDQGAAPQPARKPRRKAGAAEGASQTPANPETPAETEASAQTDPPVAETTPPVTDKQQPSNTAEAQAGETATVAQPEPPAAKEPSSPEEYEAHLDAWLAAVTTEDALDERWRTEKDMRGRCRVTGDVFDRCMGKRNARKKELRG